MRDASSGESERRTFENTKKDRVKRKDASTTGSYVKQRGTVFANPITLALIPKQTQRLRRLRRQSQPQLVENGDVVRSLTSRSGSDCCAKLLNDIKHPANSCRGHRLFAAEKLTRQRNTEACPLLSPDG